MHSEVDVVVGMLVGYTVPLVGHIMFTKTVKYLGRVNMYLKPTLLLITFILSQLLTYPDIHLIAGLLIVVWIVDKSTFTAESSTMRKVFTSTLSLVVISSTYLVTSLNIISNYQPSRFLESLIIITSAIIAFILIPVKLNVFKLKYRPERH